MKLCTLSFLFLLLSACSTMSQIEKIDVSYDPSTQARLRAITTAKIRFYPDQTCSSPTPFEIGDKGIKPPVKFSLGGYGITIGIPLPEKPPYRFSELVVAANQNLTVDAFYEDYMVGGGAKITCGPLVGTFVPSAGEDYEIGVQNSGNRCRLTINKISVVHGEYKTEPINYNPSQRCSYNPFVD